MGELLRNAQGCDPKFLRACGSIGALAALEIPDLGIYKMCRNALKMNAAFAIESGGWNAFRQRWLAAKAQAKLASKTKNATPNLRAGARRHNITAELRLKIDQANRTRIFLNRAYFDLRTVLNQAAVSNDEIAQKLARHIEMYGEGLGIRVVDSK